MDNLFSANYDKEKMLEAAMKDINEKNNPILIGRKFHDALIN